MPSSNAIYTDLSHYYDLMCEDIDYHQQSDYVRRIHQLFGNQGKHYLDLACGTGPHVRHFIDFAFSASGLDINQPMLDIAQARCPEAQFTQQDMSSFYVAEPLDLITCFLYSIHYNSDINKLKACITSAYNALKPGGIFCFSSVDKNAIDNRDGIKHSVMHDNCQLSFQSSWHYCGTGDQQTLRLTIEKTSHEQSTVNNPSEQNHRIEKIESWYDNHPMVATSFQQLFEFLSPYFKVEIFEHMFDKIVPWNKVSGNAIFVCIKKS